MANKEYLRFRFLLVVFSLILAAMIVVTIYPFNFFPPNRVQWLSNEPGIYFDGKGILHTSGADLIYVRKAVSVELLLKERLGSKNYGPREIFSFYDGSAFPSFLVGEWGGRIFLYSRFDRKEGDRWYSQFRTKERFSKGISQLVTVTFGDGEKAIYIDGRLKDRKIVRINDPSTLKFYGRFLLGNSPKMRNGWWGEIKGFAIYDRVLLPEEVATHSKEITRNGMIGLAETPGCVALYLFDEGQGNIAKSIQGNSRPFSIPESRIEFFQTMFSLPDRDMRIEFFPVMDFLKNIIFFIPFGLLTTVISLRKYETANFAVVLFVTLAAFFLSSLIEYLQLFLPTRSPGLQDIVGNVLGGAFGMLIIFYLKPKC